MLSFAGSLRIFIALDRCDMRARINTLLVLTGEKLREGPKSGALFGFACLRCAPAVFTGKRRRLLKVLYWDGTGYWILIKRLEAGTFSWPRAAAEGQVKPALKPEAFALFTDGIDMRGASPRGWYERG
jgi:transposase